MDRCKNVSCIMFCFNITKWLVMTIWALWTRLNLKWPNTITVCKFCLLNHLYKCGRLKKNYLCTVPAQVSSRWIAMAVGIPNGAFTLKYLPIFLPNAFCYWVSLFPLLELRLQADCWHLHWMLRLRFTFIKTPKQLGVCPQAWTILLRSK